MCPSRKNEIQSKHITSHICIFGGFGLGRRNFGSEAVFQGVL